MSDMTNKNDSGALTKLQQAFDWAYVQAREGIPGDSGAETFADKYLRSHPDHEAAIIALIKWQVIKAGTAGFLTGIGGALTLPVAIPVNLAATLYIQLKMIEAIAHIRGHDLKSDKVQSFAIICLTGNSAIEMLKDVGINIGSKLTAKAIQQIPKAVIIKLNQAVGFRLLTKAGTSGMVNLARIVPVVGGLVSGAIDAGTTRTIAGAAKRVFKAIPGDKSTTASGKAESE